MSPPTVAKALDYQARQVTYNVYLYFKKRKLDKTTTEHANDVNLIDLVSEITLLSKSTVQRIIKEGNDLKSEHGVACFKPKEQKHVRRKRIEVDECTEGLIRRKVIQFYTVQKEVPSVRKLNMLLKKESILQCSNEYLRQLLHKLGFTNAENDSTGMMMELPDIALDRLKYLQRMRMYRQQNCNIYFLSETVFWSLDYETEANRQNMPSIIVVHISGVNGFLNRELLMMKSATDHAQDYNWIKENVLPNIPPKSVIVMDAPDCQYLNSDQPCPTTPIYSSTRRVMVDWLQKHNVTFKQTAEKARLLEMIKSLTAKKKLNLTNLFIENGHNAIPLPQKHTDLNPTRLIWEKIKSDSNKTNPLTLFQKCTKKNWQSCFEIVNANENEYYEHDMKMDEAVDSLKVAVKIEQESDEEVEIEEYELDLGNEEEEEVDID